MRLVIIINLIAHEIYKQRDGKLKDYVRKKLGLFDICFFFLFFIKIERIIILRWSTALEACL